MVISAKEVNRTIHPRILSLSEFVSDKKFIGKQEKVSCDVDSIRFGKDARDILTDMALIPITLPFFLSLPVSRNFSVSVSDDDLKIDFTKYNGYLLPWQFRSMVFDKARYEFYFPKKEDGTQLKRRRNLILLREFVPTSGKPRLYNRIIGAEVEGRDVYL